MARVRHQLRGKAVHYSAKGDATLGELHVLLGRVFRACLWNCLNKCGVKTYGCHLKIVYCLLEELVYTVLFTITLFHN